MVHQVLLTAIYFLSYIPQAVFSSKGYTSEVFTNAKFQCNVSHRSTYTVSSELQCVHRCSRNNKCELINYRIDPGVTGVNCEIFELPHDHFSCSTVNGVTNWKALVFKDMQDCRYLKYNYCYPCMCPPYCTAASNSECICENGAATLPTIFISFENEIPNSKVSYDRGVDTAGKSIVTLMNQADIGWSSGRLGNVLRLNGIDAGAVVGKFQSHPLNNPNGKEFTVSLWVKVVTPQSGSQILVGSGKIGDNTGLFIKLKTSATVIEVKRMTTSKFLSLSKSVGNALRSWAHIAIVNVDGPGMSLKLFLNGKKIAEDTTETSHSASATKFPTLAFGAHSGLSTLVHDQWDIHIDDFAFWLTNLSNAQVAFLAKQDHTVCSQ